jgi:hypothetical protein
VDGTTVRSTMPSSSSSLSRSDKSLSLSPGTAARISLNRPVPASIERTIAPVHRRPMISIACV